MSIILQIGRQSEDDILERLISSPSDDFRYLHMPTRISEAVKSAVIRQWLDGIARDTIAANNDLSDGGVTNIISQWKQGLILSSRRPKRVGCSFEENWHYPCSMRLRLSYKDND
jgi:hypothetical protein